jgi:glycosyltransferase involved in cell wall biosynthesis
MASSQLSVAVANGLDPSRAFVCPIGVDQSLHKFIPDSDLVPLCSSNQTLASIMPRSCVGFVARYWDKPAYTQRKRYQLIMDIVKLLSSMDIPVVILGPGWENYEDRYQANNVHYFATKYKNYPIIYNLMRVFCSLSLHEGGPMPLLESMSCGVRPVVTNTGFAFDVLNDLNHINLLATNAIKSRIISEILNAYYQKSDASAFIQQAQLFSFEEAAQKLYSKIT